MEGNQSKKQVELPSDYTSEQDSYSSESDQERAEFIQRAKKILENINCTSQDNQLAGQSNHTSVETLIEQNFDINDQKFYYQGQRYDSLPESLNGIENFANIIKSNFQSILQSLNQADREKLYALLPASVKDKERLLTQTLRGDRVGNLGQSPLDQFQLKLQSGVFTKSFQQYQEYRQQLTTIKQRDKIMEDLQYIESLKRRERFAEESQLHVFLNQLIQPVQNIARADDVLSEDDSEEDDEYTEEEKEIYNQIHAEFEELTSGYTTISSNRGDYSNYRRPINNLIQQQAASMSLNRLTTLSQMQGVNMSSNADPLKQQNAQNSNEQSFSSKTDQQNKKSSIISLNAKSGLDSASKKKASISSTNRDFGDSKLLEQIMNSERFKNLKVHKNQVTLAKTSSEWIEIYRRQETERYEYPTRPWIYYNEDGTTSIVGPIIKKKTQQTNQKPRDHPQMHQNRPAIVTLLCLARDAASRLPDGVGTRADILELIKQSQWLKSEGTDPASLNNIVSGALDRLHYEEDACVKYDSDRKLWIYLHKNRTIDYLDWLTHSSSEKPNTMENNSFNPYLGTEREHIWKNSLHKEKKSYSNVRYEHDNDNSESMSSTTNNMNININLGSNPAVTQPVQPAQNTKLIVKIRFDNKEEVKPAAHKRSKQSNVEYDEFGEQKPHKRPKY